MSRSAGDLPHEAATTHEWVKRVRALPDEERSSSTSEHVAEYLRKLEARDGAFYEGEPWIPRELSHDRYQSDLRYVVVDDLEDDYASLAISLWPVVSRLGRVSFHPEGFDRNGGSDLVKLQLKNLNHLLEQSRSGSPEPLATRPVRIGDTFAVPAQQISRLKTDSSTELVNFVDVTASARELAKIAFYSAASGTLDLGDESDTELLGMIEPDSFTELSADPRLGTDPELRFRIEQSRRDYLANLEPTDDELRSEA